MFGRKALFVPFVFAIVSLAGASNIQNVGLIATAQAPVAGTYGIGVTADASGNFMSAGTQFGGTSTDFFLKSYHPNGQLINSATGSGPGGNSKAQYVVTDKNGAIYVAGTQQGYGTDNDWFVVKIVGTTFSFFNTFDGPASKVDSPCGIAVDTSGNVFVAGNVDGSAANTSNIAVVKYNSSGAIVWKNTAVTQAVQPFANSMCLSPDGIVYICGRSGAIPKFTIWEVDSTGSLKGTVGTSDYTGEAFFIKADSNGHVAAAGTTSDGTHPNALTTLYSGGLTGFTKTYSPPPNKSCDADGVDFDLSGNVYVLGTQYSGDNKDQTVALKYDIAGNVKWQKNFTGLSSSFPQAIGKGLVVDKYGDAYVSGLSYFSDSYKKASFILKYNTTGQQMFSAYHGVLNCTEIPSSLYMDANNDLYTTGRVNDSNSGYFVITEHWAQASICNNDTYNVDVNGTLTVGAPGVLANDYFTKGATIAVKTTTAHGTLTMQANGSFKYVPNSGYLGDDTFQYVANKLAGGGSSNPATVTIHVQAP